MKKQKIVSWILCIILILSFFPTNLFALNYVEEGDIRKAVGIMNYNSWVRSDGETWINANPFLGTEIVSATAPYSFSFPNRKVKKVNVEPYYGTPESYIKTSRGESWSTYARSSSNNISVNISGLTGIGTDTVSFNTNVSAVLNADTPEEVTGEATYPLDPNARGFRTEFPVLFIIELEPIAKPLVEVQHFNKQTGERLKPDEEFEVEPNTSITRNKESFTGMTYLYNVISEDGGATFKDLSESPSRTLTITKDTIFRFYYIPAGELVADLEINANPSVIEKGKTATVQFTLNAGGSRGTYPIKKYEFWFSDSSSFDGSYNHSTSNNAYVTSKNGVKPNSTWHGKVKV